MDRKEFKKRWIMGTIQPELFYIPWKKSNEPCVFIWSKVYRIDKTCPTIDECKNQNKTVSIGSYDYGFMIFDEKGSVVSDTGFCVPLPKGKYYAIHYKGRIGASKVSFARAKIPFEVKNDDVYIYVEETTRHYTLNVKFEPAEWKEVTARYYITQECDKGGYYELPECDENVRIASLFEWYRARGFEALEDNSEYQDLSISRAEDGDDEYWKTKWTCTSAPDVRLATGYVGRNDWYTNTLSLYPNIELHKESQTKSGQKLKVKFDIIEDNLNYQCINYSIDYVTSCRYKYLRSPSPNYSGEYVYNRICVSADRTWIATNGFFADTEDGLYKALYNVPDESYDGIWTGGQVYNKSILLQIGETSVEGNQKISWGQGFCHDWDIGKDINLTVTPTNYVNAWFTPSDSKFVGECYLNNRPEILDSYIGDEWHIYGNDFSTFYSSPISEDHKSFESYSNAYDNKTQLTNDEIIQIYQSENESNFYVDEVISYKNYSSGLQDMLPYNNTSMPYRPFISSEEMKSSGYIIPNGKYVSLYNNWDFYYEYRSQDDSGYVVVHYTPIRNDGFVLSKEQIYSYFNRLTNETKEKIEEGSSSTRLYERDYWFDSSQQMYTGYRLILHVDNTIKVSKEEVDDYHNGIYSENVKQIIKKQDTLKDRISFIQNRFNTLYLEDNPNVNLSTVNRQSNPYIEI